MVRMGVFVGLKEKRELVDMIQDNPALMEFVHEIEQEDMLDTHLAIMFMVHFPDGKFRCRFCTDHIEGDCDGFGLRGFKQVRRCMEAKIKEGELQLIA